MVCRAGSPLRRDRDGIEFCFSFFSLSLWELSSFELDERRMALSSLVPL